MLNTILIFLGAGIGGMFRYMKTIDVIIVRVYVMESTHLLNSVVNYLKTEAKIRGISVFRAINGFWEAKAND